MRSPYCSVHRAHESAEEAAQRVEARADIRRRDAEKRRAEGKEPGSGGKKQGEQAWEQIAAKWPDIYPSGKGVQGDVVSINPSDLEDPLSGVMSDLRFWDSHNVRCWVKPGTYFLVSRDEQFSMGSYATNQFFNLRLEVTSHSNQDRSLS